MLPLKQDLISSARPSLLIVMAAVVLVLLIGCVNIANLQLARAAARERDVAVRRALGASPARIVREHLAESLLIAVLGGGVGLVLTLWSAGPRAAAGARHVAAPIGGRPQLDHRRVQRWRRRCSPACCLDWRPRCNPRARRSTTCSRAGARPATASAPGRAAGSSSPSSRLRWCCWSPARCSCAASGACSRCSPDSSTRGVTVARVWLPQPNDPSTGPYFSQQARARFFRDLLARLEPATERVGLSTGLPHGHHRVLRRFRVEGWPDDVDRGGHGQELVRRRRLLRHARRARWSRGRIARTPTTTTPIRAWS